MLLAPITPMARDHYKLGDVSGVLVVAVDRQSEAYGRGIGPGDVIENVDGTPVTTPARALQLMQQTDRQDRSVALLVRMRHGLQWVALQSGVGANPGSGAGTRKTVSSTTPARVGSGGQEGEASAAFVRRKR